MKPLTIQGDGEPTRWTLQTGMQRACAITRNATVAFTRRQKRLTRTAFAPLGRHYQAGSIERYMKKRNW